MAPTKVGEEVLDLVIPYIHDIEDRNALSLVSRKFCETDGITRKRLTVHTLYCPNPASSSKRFPFIEALTLKGPPTYVNVIMGYDVRITPWIEQLALEFRCLKQLHIRGLVVQDEDLETLARTRGKDLTSLKISKCEGFSTDGLRHVSKYCNQLTTLCLGYFNHINVKDGIWLHELALNSTVLEKLNYKNMNKLSDAEDVTLLASKCCKSLISLKMGPCCLSKLGEAFRYAVKLEQFGGAIRGEESELAGFQFPPNMSSLSLDNLAVDRYSIVLPFLNQIRKLKLNVFSLFPECQCLLFKGCPNLEVLSTIDGCGDTGLQVIGKFCKKLRKLTYKGEVTHVGLISLAMGCTDLESLDVLLTDISNETLECVGTHLKNLRKFSMHLVKKHGTTNLPLDNEIQAMLMGCSKLERLDIWHEGLTDVGLEYIGKYGNNFRSLSLTRIENSNAGLVKLSEGCPRLRKLKLNCCPFNKQDISSCVFNIPSLRYVWVRHRDTRVWVSFVRSFNFEILVRLRDISNEALECLGTHSKNLHDFRIWLGKEDGKTDLLLDNGVRAILMGCNKLERLDINLRNGGLTDMGL